MLARQIVGQHHLQIRRQQHSRTRDSVRKQLQQWHDIQQTLSNIPRQSFQASEWSLHLHSLLRQSVCELPPSSVVSIFKVAQTVPNAHTLTLLSLVLTTAAKSTIDVIFQYDIVNLLHTVLQTAFKDTSNYINTIKVCFTILTHLCRVNDYIRNFIIQNHKSYIVCLKGYKILDQEIKIQFMHFIQATTVFAFKGYNEQYTRIISKVIHFYEEQIKKYKQSVENNKHSHQQYLIILLKIKTNLLKMRQKWILSQLQSNYSSYQLILSTTNNLVLQQSTLCFLLHYIQCFGEPPLSLYLCQIALIGNCYALRHTILFTLSNYLCDDALTMDEYEELSQRLFPILIELLQTELDARTNYQLAYIMRCVMEYTPKIILQQYEFLQAIITCLVNCKEEVAVCLLLETIVKASERVPEWNYRAIIKEEYRDKLDAWRNSKNRENCSVAQKIQIIINEIMN